MPAILLALLGLVASAASLADSLAPTPAFCAETGCAVVRASAWAKPLGVPLPVLGVAFFALATALAVAGPRFTRVRTLVAIAGGVFALGLVAVQAFAIGAWCKLCLVADVAALAHAVAVVLTPASPASAARRAIVGMAAAAAIAVPLARGADTHADRMTSVRTAGLPDVVAKAQVPGALTIVDFVDFECPFCRALHGRLVTAVDRANVPVKVVRKMVPLSMHPGAMPAAIAWCCADEQGRGDEMAEALIAAPTAELTPAGCERIAARLGLDMDRYRACAAAPRTQQRIERDLADARAAGIRSLPTIYIGEHAFVGAKASVAELERAMLNPQRM
jgi:uncharacterized membrane protein/predicted DsbA family dithiol-disulfide isomerase